MKKKLMILMIMVAFMTTTVWAKAADHNRTLPSNGELPTHMTIISQTSEANQTIITAIDLSNNELVIICISSSVLYDHGISCSRTGIIMDPNQPLVQGSSRPFVDQQ